MSLPARSIIQSALDEYYEAFNTMKKERVLAVFAKDAEFIDYTMGRNMMGRDALAGFIDETWSRCPYFHLEPRQALIDEDRVAVQLVMSGAGKVDAAGEPTPSHLWRIPSTSFFRFREQQITWKADCWNALTISRQIGWLRTIPMMLARRTGR